MLLGLLLATPAYAGTDTAQVEETAAVAPEGDAAARAVPDPVVPAVVRTGAAMEADRDVAVELTDPGRLVCLAIVLAGLVLLAWAWREHRRPEGGAPADRRHLAGLTGALLVLYGLLFTGQYVPGSGDEALYLSIGRSVVRTGEFLSNGAPAVSVPMGWPYLIAAMLRISQSFVWLNLLPLSLVVAALVLWYLVLRRLCPPQVAIASVLVAALLFHWQRCAVHFYSEAMFFPLVPLGVLLAMQVAETRMWAGRLAALALTAAAMVLSRFSGALTLPLLGMALWQGQRWPQARQYVGAAIIAGVLAGTFFGVRALLEREALATVAQVEQTTAPPDQAPAATEIPPTIKQRVERDLAVEDRMMDRAVDAGTREYGRRILHSGTWLSLLFWPPAEMVKRSESLEPWANLIGWGLIGLLSLTAAVGIRRRDWVWTGAALYCLAFVLVWPEPNGRYLAPVAPMLLAGLWLGGRQLGGWMARRSRMAVQAATAGLLGSIVLCNVPIYLVEVWVNQSPTFHSKVLAGEHREMASICRYLNQHVLQDEQLAVANDSGYQHIVRVTNFLTDRSVVVAPFGGLPTPKTLEWARAGGIRYYVCRSPRSPRRLWHVRLSGPAADCPPGSESYLELYEITDDRAVRIQPALPWKVDRVYELPEDRLARLP